MILEKQLQLFDDKVAYPYIYKLWLDKKLPVEYGRELLGCDCVALSNAIGGVTEALELCSPRDSALLHASLGSD